MKKIIEYNSYKFEVEDFEYEIFNRLIENGFLWADQEDEWDIVNSGFFTHNKKMEYIGDALEKMGFIKSDYINTNNKHPRKFILFEKDRMKFMHRDLDEIRDIYKEYKNGTVIYEKIDK